MPPDFPELDITTERVYPALPAKVEVAMLGRLTTDILLKNEDEERKWWAPLRRREQVPNRPLRIHSHFSSAGHEMKYYYKHSPGLHDRPCVL